jgi:hypothetical protein
MNTLTSNTLPCPGPPRAARLPPARTAMLRCSSASTAAACA